MFTMTMVLVSPFLNAAPANAQLYEAAMQPQEDLSVEDEKVPSAALSRGQTFKINVLKYRFKHYGGRRGSGRSLVHERADSIDPDQLDCVDKQVSEARKAQKDKPLLGFLKLLGIQHLIVTLRDNFKGDTQIDALLSRGPIIWKDRTIELRIVRKSDGTCLVTNTARQVEQFAEWRDGFDGAANRLAGTNPQVERVKEDADPVLKAITPSRDSNRARVSPVQAAPLR